MGGIFNMMTDTRKGVMNLYTSSSGSIFIMMTDTRKGVMNLYTSSWAVYLT